MTENLFAIIRNFVLDEMLVLLPDLGEDVRAKIEVTPTRDPAHGDMASNAALVAAKPAGKNPREIAQALSDRLAARPEIAKAELAGRVSSISPCDRLSCWRSCLSSWHPARHTGRGRQNPAA